MSDIKVGDRVKVEFEGTISGLRAGWGSASNGVWVTTGTDGAELLAFEDSVTVIPKPIVLPTKRNALIEIGSLVLIRGTRSAGYPWISSNFNEYSNEEMTQWAKDKPEAYRVIFAGEDDE